MTYALILVLVLIVVGVKIAAFFALPIWLRWTGNHAPRKAFEDRCALIESGLQTFYPEGNGPFPAVLLFHGCGGVRQISQNYAQLAVQNGFAALIVDSLTPRGIDYDTALETVCKGKTLWGRERAGDVYAALEIARNDPRIEGDKLALAGWSHGGWAILDGLALAAMGKPPDGLIEAPDKPFKGVQGVFVVYPFASAPSLARSNRLNPPAPIEAVLVTSDTHAKETHVAAVMKREREAGADIEVTTLKGVTHGFDEPDHHPDSILRYDGAASKATEARFTAFLRKHLATQSH